MISLSSNHFSVDDQAVDVIRHLSFGNAVEQAHYRDFKVEFPEYDAVVDSGFDTHIVGVDSDYMSWVIDWIEANTSVIWVDGEPVILEESDSEDRE